MATQLTGDPNLWPVSAAVPDDGDAQSAASVDVTFEALLDRTAWQRARMEDPMTVPLFGAQQTNFLTVLSFGPGAVVPRFIPWPVSFASPAPTNFGRAGWVQTDVTDEGGLWWFVPIQHSLEVTMVAASLRGDDGPGTNPGFPAAADRPRLRLYRQSVDGTNVEPLLAPADETATKAQYEAHHTIPENPAIPFGVTAPGVDFSFTPGEYLIIEFVGHKGPNVGANTLKLYGIKMWVKVL